MQQNIDQLFKDGVQGLEGQPPGVIRNPEANWNRIEAMLGEEPQRRRVAWIWVSAAAAVALLIALAWGLSAPAPQPETWPMAIVDSITQPEPMAVTEEPAEKAPLPAEGQPFQTQQSVTGLASTQATTLYFASPGAEESLHRDQWMSFGNKSGSKHSPTETSISYRNAVGADKALSFEWKAGENQPINIAPNGTYAVTSTAANGCVALNGDVKLPVNQRFLSWDQQVFAGKLNLKNSSTDAAKADVNKPILGFFALADSVRIAVPADPYGYEDYTETVENAYFATTQEPLSTFSIDVDRASYANHRRFIEQSQLPPKYSVRVEEFINYFPYEYQEPRGEAPFSILPEVTTCPWNPMHKIARIALKGREIRTENLPPSNLVFLLDVSGSMESEDKLPLLKKALGMLTEQLREQDHVSIVVYAGAAGLVLPPTSGIHKQKIMQAMDELSAGGSTAGGEGIELAYATARQHFKQGGNNRVILATDGDFNVGISDQAGLEKLITKKREEGVFLSVLGFGEGNLQDGTMELLADKGNGNYNYIDSEQEAKKVLVNEFGGTLFTIAKDVKVQVEFNPAQVSSYRLIGYENRKLRNEDFANDKIDAGELGAGHTVTALYEIIPAREATGAVQDEQLKYQQRVPTPNAFTDEVLTVKLRYKEPNGSVSKLLVLPLRDDGRNIAQTSLDFRWAVAVAEYGLIMRQSEFKGMSSLEQVLALARSAVGADKAGYRKEFIALVQKAMAIEQAAKLDARQDGN